MVAGAVLLPRNSDLRALLGAFGGLFFTAGLILAQVRMLPWMVGALSRPLALLSPAVALLAGRAVLRYRKRSAMTAATLILGIMLVTSVGTVFRQIISDSGTYTRTLYLADAVVKGRSVGLADRLAAIDGVTTVVATGQELQTLLIGWDYAKADPAWSEQQRREPTVWGDDHRNLLFVVPTALAAVSRLNRFGRVTGTVGAAEGVVVTEEQAKQWGFRLGDTLRLRTDAGFDHGRQLFRELPPVKVVAIVERSAFGARDVLVSRSLLPEGPDEAVHFSYDQARRDAVLKAVRSVLAEPAYGMTSLRDLSDALEAERQAGNQRLAIFGAVAVVIFLVAAFGLFNSMMTGFQQRLQEMAALRAAGATPAQLMWQVIVEALLVGLAGTFLGIAAGLVFAKAVAAGIGEPIYLRYGVPFFVASLVAGPLLAALAGLVPASRFATRKNPL
ncbi:MAG TPA: FtsX-like permease family protein, partial [Symbiobacteriaceae bacterium]|nr:FtsX-like permease family protein [Symbiobacteriaceae bacterium]